MGHATSQSSGLLCWTIDIVRVPADTHSMEIKLRDPGDADVLEHLDRLISSSEDPSIIDCDAAKFGFLIISLKIWRGALEKKLRS